MDRVTLNKDKLLETVKKNRDAHARLYQQALEGYRKDMSSTLTSMLRRANENEDVDFTTLYSIQKPQCHTKEYDRVINMLSHHTGTSVDLTNRDFGRYFEDDWEWKEQWLTSNAKYTSMVGH